MKLSEAIVLGSIETKQLFDKLINDDGTETCAFGAVYVAAGLDKHTIKHITKSIATQLFTRNGWLWCVTEPVTCPVCHNIYQANEGACMLIPHLNDFHRWTRPQIAAFIATIEPQDAPSVEVVGTTESSCDVVTVA